jgi:hypothetical protein
VERGRWSIRSPEAADPGESVTQPVKLHELAMDVVRKAAAPDPEAPCLTRSTSPIHLISPES